MVRKQPPKNNQPPKPEQDSAMIQDIGNLKRDVSGSLRDIADCKREVVDCRCEVKEAVSKRRWWAIFAISVVGFLGFTSLGGILYIQKRILDTAENMLTKQVKTLYEEKNVARVVNDIIWNDANNLIRTKVDTEVNPIVQGLRNTQEEQSKTLAEFKKDQEKYAKLKVAIDEMNNKMVVNRAMADEQQKILSSQIDQLTARAEESLSALAKSVTAGDLAVRELKAQIQFSSTILAAQNDDRRAYDQLWVWAEDNSFAMQKVAEQAVQTLLEQHNPPGYREGFSVPWAEGIDPQKLTLSALRKDLGTTPPYVRVGILEFVWKKRTDISKQERLQVLVDVLRTDESLRVVEYAGRYFAAGTGDKFKPIAIRQHLKWWEENKDSIK